MPCCRRPLFLALAGLFFLSVPQALAFFEIPRGLSESDRLEIMRTIGLGSATKLLNNPYPLGGYSGFEVGFSVEFIDIRDLRRLGCVPGSAGCPNTKYSDDTEWRFSRLTLGKGLYEDFDIFFHFVPPIGGVRINGYGGALRWSAFQARFLPINVSLIGHLDQLNYSDSFINRNMGIEALVGVNVDNFALYFGGGWLEAQGTFTGSATGDCEACSVTDPNQTVLDRYTNTVRERVTSTHTVVGLSLHYANLFAAAQVDRYQDAVYSMKMGLRF